MSGAPSDAIGLDLGGTFLKGARVSPEGRIVERLHEPLAGRSNDALLRQLGDAATRLARGAPARGVGVGLPGIVDRQGGCVRNAPALPALNGLRLIEDLTRRCGLPVRLENDANAAALAEAWVGSGRDVEALLFVTLGTGVGAGLVLGGRVWEGHSGYAGELGHIQAKPEGAPCACGSRGCVETLAGARHWRRRAEEQLASGRRSLLAGRELDAKTIVVAAQQGDAVALEVVEGAAGALGVGISAALLLLNPDRVVIGGGVSAAGSFLFDRILEQTRRRCFAQVFADCSFRLATLGNDAGVLGAARAAMLAADAASRA